MKSNLNLFAVLATAVFACAQPAAAQDTVNRPHPLPTDLSQAPRAVITPGILPLIYLNGKPARLTAGAHIYGSNNLLVLPSNVPAGALVRYQLDQNGDVKAVWILTAAEARQR